MLRLGRDDGYYGLSYFEYTEESAARRLTELGVT